MLRHVQIDGASKAEAATLFGMSRPTFYQTEAAFAREGLASLLPRQRGPKGAHKLTAEVMGFIDQRLQGDGSLHARALAQEIEAQLGLSVHPRSIERAIRHKTVDESSLESLSPSATAVYESLRADVLAGRSRPEGLAALHYHGMLHGLAILLRTPPPASRVPASHPLSCDSTLVRLLRSGAAHSFGANPCLLTDSRR